MSKKILLLDLDDTVRRTKSGAQFINDDPTDQEIIPGVREALDQDYIKVGVTNQGGVAANKKSLQNAIIEQQLTLELLPELSEIYFCPDFEETECWLINRDTPELCVKRLSGGFRKPNPGMLLLAMSEYDADPENALMIGDRHEDQQSRHRCWCKILMGKRMASARGAS